MQIYGNRSSELRKLHKNEVTRFMDSLGDKEAQEKYVQIIMLIHHSRACTVLEIIFIDRNYGQMSH